ncbi:hypothetical protein LF65_01694 [Clostridium beijerinckii]|uniref:Uncharacterized protein n=1 Tax=Clostridium beijerinckii TaxID=1520 RepID=A0A0B5QK61_CLOBE|nr:MULTISPECIES: hypothetical protein [Clostridium]AJG98297.1 hypothetical protein LF65_01694 [Clostridium beijerinckii]
MQFISENIAWIILVTILILAILEVLYEKYLKKKSIFNLYKKIYIREIDKKGNETLINVSDIYQIEDKVSEYIDSEYKSVKEINLKKAKLKRKLNSVILVDGITILSICISVIMTLYTTVLTNVNTVTWNVINLEYKNIDTLNKQLDSKDLSEDKKSEISKNISTSYDNIKNAIKSTTDFLSTPYILLLMLLLLLIFFFFSNIVKERIEYEKAFYSLIIELLEGEKDKIKEKELKSSIKSKVEDIRREVLAASSEITTSRKLLELRTTNRNL